MNTKHQATATGNLLLVMDHQSAQIYRTTAPGSDAEQVTHDDRDGHKGHVHSSHDYRKRNEHPDNNAYFGEVVEGLKGNENILIFGSGSGSSSAMELFVTWLNDHHKDIAERVMDTVKVDQSHLTEGELLAKAREIFDN